MGRLRKLNYARRTVIAGPLATVDNEDPGDTGFSDNFIVSEFPTQEDAKASADAGPYVAAGAHSSVEVKPFK